MIALTGHTSGLGQSIESWFECDKLFSRSTGYDIRRREDRARIAVESMSSNVFINNAIALDDGFAQTYLLWELSKVGFGGLIINVASSIETVVRDAPRPYDIYKRSLMDASKQLYYCGVKSTIIAPGAIDCGMGASAPGKKLHTQQVISAIEYMIEQDGAIQQIIMTGRFN